jgi:hypothetical protein
MPDRFFELLGLLKGELVSGVFRIRNVVEGLHDESEDMHWYTVQFGSREETSFAVHVLRQRIPRLVQLRHMFALDSFTEFSRAECQKAADEFNMGTSACTVHLSPRGQTSEGLVRLAFSLDIGSEDARSLLFSPYRFLVDQVLTFAAEMGMAKDAVLAPLQKS